MPFRWIQRRAHPRRLSREHRLAVLTTNESDFVALHRSCPWHHGILLIEVEANVRAQAKRIDSLLKRLRNIRGVAVWLTNPNVSRKWRRRKRRGE